MLVCILDTETGGLDAKKHPLVEVGAVLWSMKDQTMIKCFSSLVHATSNEAEAVNGIPLSALLRAPSAEAVKESLRKMCVTADAIMAHNGSFDAQWLPEIVALQKPWIDTCNDVEWPRAGASRSLVSLCLDHGVGVSHAHRAITDCLLLVRLLERVSETHDLEILLLHAMRPKAVYEVAERDFSEERNAQAKAAGFRWEASVKGWRRKMATDDIGKLPFAVREVRA